jgi:uncharacterized protein YecA (UPF0149 family)
LRSTLKKIKRIACNPREQDFDISVEKSSMKVGRNDPCPCGSGKKYKRCHG